MIRRFILVLSLALSAGLVSAQEAATPAPAAPAGTARPLSEFDASYIPSPSISARLQRDFLRRIGLSAGPVARSRLEAAFRDKSAMALWEELAGGDGLKPNDVADALTSYWILNWITANGAYTAKLDNAPVRHQLRLALANDPGFQQLNDHQKQELAEGYVLDFLLLHGTLNDAVARRDVPVLNALAAASVVKFQRDMGVNLLALKPGPGGFEPKTPPAAPAAN